ncbi:MAG: hypothetical protein WD270_05670, partial [Acetobacterales bacterium]
IESPAGPRWKTLFQQPARSSAIRATVADRLADAASISFALSWTKRKPTRITGNKVAKATST